MKTTSRIALVLACAVVSTARADEAWLLSAEVDAAIPLRAPQRSWFRPGGAGALTLSRSLHPRFVLGVRARGGWLTDGPAPADTTLADPGTGSFVSVGLNTRWRLTTHGPSAARATGLFVELGGGVMLTGDLVRATFEGGFGWGFAAGSVTVAPVARYVHVLQPSAGQLDARDASLLLVGLELSLFDPRDVPPPTQPLVYELEADQRDRDGDGLDNDVDGCPDEPEDRDGFEDEDGCPDFDDDADGIADLDDACPREPEDRDGFQDEDGCPDPDDDRDGILDVDDACPREPETVNGVEDLDGCPDEGVIELINDRVVIEERVLFDFERARVKSAARPALEAIVELVRQHPEWTRLRIEGHADVRGDEEFNQRLSERRARNVMRALLEHGLEPRAIEFVGLGSRRPRDERRTEAAHQRNRRVEFVVVREGERPVAGGREEDTDATLD
ncbi:MAG: OmpA family protein [Sandaracinus sp.]|nr:OmpA family protein [Sandaracinus sp.]MCB9616049.1 OmpA family protein [Sandaracinus sp.]MCB9632432.1 OmpA family protein [Sandaracinus sp.]